MPPDDETMVISTSLDTHCLYVKTGRYLNEYILPSKDHRILWTPYTPEKWKELNNGK